MRGRELAYSVPFTRIPLLEDPPFAIGLFWLGTAIGYRALRRLRVPLVETFALERGLLSAAVGMGLLQFVPFVLSLGGGLTRSTILIALLLLALLFARDMGRVAVGAARAIRSTRRHLPDGWVLVCLALVALTMFLILLHAESPPIDTDELGYHLTAPKRWLQAGSLVYLPTLIHTQGSLGLEMLYTIAMAIWSDTAAKLIHFVFGLLTLASVVALGRRLRGVPVGVAAVVLFMYGIPHRIDVFVCASAFVEMGVALECLMAVLAWQLWRRSRSPGWWYCAALCAGFAVSFKLTAILLVVALILVDGLDGLYRGESRANMARRCALFAGISVAPLAPWLGRNWFLTGNPLYPLAAGLFPSRDWNATSGRALSLFFRYYNWGPDRLNSLTLRQRVEVIDVAVVACVIVAAIVWHLWRDTDARLLLAVTVLLLIGGLLTTGLYLRLLMPALPLLYLLFCMALARPLTRSRILHVALPGILLLYGIQLVREGDWRTSGPAAVGRMSRESYLVRRLPIMPIWDRVNALAPPDAHVLSAAFQCTTGITGGLSYYCDRPTQTTDAYLQAHLRLDRWDHFLSDLIRDRINYVVTMDGAHEIRIGPPSTPAANELAFSRRLTQRYGRRLFGANGMTVYRIYVPEMGRR
jgi:hypothetical protein